MKINKHSIIMPVAALALPVIALVIPAQVGNGAPTLARPQGPCDVYAADGIACAAAHSTTRALYASYNGPLYQVMRQSDGKTLDIGVVQPTATDAGGYADAAAQDAFSAGTYCWITTIYDQSGKGNHLVQAPRGGFSGPAMGGYNNIPIADMAPVTVMGHKVYGVFIAPGMGLRWNDAKGTAVDDQAEGQYWVVNGLHFNGGCCFDYGNAETDSRDDGDGTMETTYYGNGGAWYHGQPPGPWIMTDQENNLVGCVNPSPNDKLCRDLPTITWRFVTATADGEPHHWRTLGGDAQQGDLKVMFDGPRIKNNNNSYDPMRKQGAILLGNGGDNSRGSQGTFYEGAMTAANVFPSAATQQKIQANIVAARYDVACLSVAPASATEKPPGLQTFSPGSSQETTVTFKNALAAPVTGVKLSLDVPSGWTAVVSGSSETAKTVAGPVAPGASVSATFKVTSGSAAFNGDLVGRVAWTANGMARSETAAEKVRNVSPVKINEFAISAGAASSAGDSFIELFNAGDAAIDLSNWTLTHHASMLPVFSSVKIPAGTTLAPRSFHVLGLAGSGLAVPARKGDTTLFVRSVAGLNVGDTVEIGTGSSKEVRKIASVGTAAGNTTTLWQPLPDGPVLTLKPGSTNVPFTSPGGRGGGGSPFEVGQKIAIGFGATFPDVARTVEKYEVVTVTAVGKPGTQAYLAANAKAGDTNIKVSSVGNISVGDKIRLDIESVGYGIETATVKQVGTQSRFNPNNVRSGDTGTGLDLVEPLKFNHAANMPFSVQGTGISFEPATKETHISNEPILPLGTGITLDSPLAGDHEINSAVRNPAATTAGFQGTPNQWFGGPALGGNGSMVLRDAAGLVVDSLNYGELADPWAAEGYQGTSPGGGCYAVSPGAGGGFGGGRGQAAAAGRSAGRFPDGADTDDNERDFHIQNTSALAAGCESGANNIKVTSVSGLTAGQTLIIDSGDNREPAVIATVGTPGATTVSTNAAAGATVISVASTMGFSAGQTITIGLGDNNEKVVVASVAGGRRGGFGNRGPSGGSITIASPLAKEHAADAPVSGSGITLTTGLKRSHSGGAVIAGNVPTPGAPNQYVRR
jgi:hypothetical protein